MKIKMKRVKFGAPFLSESGRIVRRWLVERNGRPQRISFGLESLALVIDRSVLSNAATDLLRHLWRSSPPCLMCLVASQQLWTGEHMCNSCALLDYASEIIDDIMATASPSTVTFFESHSTAGPSGRAPFSGSKDVSSATMRRNALL
jgi:hypothetical protein